MGNPIGIGLSTVNQRTMDYIMLPGTGRDAFVRFWALLAAEVRRHPSAVAAELLNEPVTIRRRAAFDTWRAAAEAIHRAVPDMAVSLADTLEGVTLPKWLVRLMGPGVLLDADTDKWITQSSTVFVGPRRAPNPEDSPEHHRRPLTGRY